MVLIFMGAPGSGKGTQAKRLEAERGYKHLSTGDLLREEGSRDTRLGQKIQGILKQGELVDDQTVLELLQKNCDLGTRSYIFDGFPRNIDQARLLEENLLGDYPYWGVYFKMSMENLLTRLTARRVCRDCGALYHLRFLPPREAGICDHCNSKDLYRRDDDREEVIKNRLNIYNDTIGAVLDFYRSRNVLREVPADQASDEVFGELKAIVDERDK